MTTSKMFRNILSPTDIFTVIYNRASGNEKGPEPGFRLINIFAEVSLTKSQ